MKKENPIKTSIFFIAIFFTICLALVSFPLFVFVSSGEIYNLEKVVEQQLSSDKIVLFGPTYSTPFKYYKAEAVKRTNPEIITLGSSRVMQIRSEFFKKNASFFNAGGGASNIVEFNEFLGRIEKSGYPKFIIIGLDQNFFNENWFASPSKNFNSDIFRVGSYLIRIRDSSVKTYEDYFLLKKFTITKILNRKDRIGLNAVMNEEGFRNDGSYRYGQIISNRKKSNTYNLSVYYKNIEQNEGRFTYGKEVSEFSKKELAFFLKSCKEKNITVIGFLPPFPDEIMDKMRERKEDYQYLFELNSSLRPIFDKEGFTFYDFTDLRTVGSSSCEILDGLHGSEKSYLRAFIKMAENDEYLKKNTNSTYLKKRLAEADDCVSVFS